MRQVLIGLDMALEALFGSGRKGLRPSRRHANLMNVMAGGTGDAFFGVFGLLPVDVLLVVTFGKLVGIDMLDVTACK